MFLATDARNDLLDGSHIGGVATGGRLESWPDFNDCKNALRDAMLGVRPAMAQRLQKCGSASRAYNSGQRQLRQINVIGRQKPMNTNVAHVAAVAAAAADPADP